MHVSYELNLTLSPSQQASPRRTGISLPNEEDVESSDPSVVRSRNLHVCTLIRPFFPYTLAVVNLNPLSPSCSQLTKRQDLIQKCLQARGILSSHPAFPSLVKTLLHLTGLSLEKGSYHDLVSIISLSLSLFLTFSLLLPGTLTSPISDASRLVFPSSSE